MKNIIVLAILLATSLGAKCQCVSTETIICDSTGLLYSVVTETLILGRGLINPYQYYPCDFHIDKPAISHLPTTQTSHIFKLAAPILQTSSNSPLIPIGGRPADILYVIDDMRIMRN